MLQNDLGPIRHLGHIAMTPGVKKLLSGRDLLKALLFQMHDGTGNDKCPLPSRKLEGCRVLTVYRSSTGQSFWIITEADRSVTTILMPEEF
jgi:hypothetical protein